MIVKHCICSPGKKEKTPCNTASKQSEEDVLRWPENRFRGQKSEMGLRWTSEKIEISVSTYCRGTSKHSGNKKHLNHLPLHWNIQELNHCGVNKLENSNGTKMCLPNWNDWQTKRVYKTIYLILVPSYYFIGKWGQLNPPFSIFSPLVPYHNSSK